jgi:hypothetical protein
MVQPHLCPSLRLLILCPTRWELFKVSRRLQAFPQLLTITQDMLPSGYFPPFPLHNPIILQARFIPSSRTPPCWDSSFFFSPGQTSEIASAKLNSYYPFVVLALVLCELLKAAAVFFSFSYCQHWVLYVKRVSSSALSH